MIQKEIELVTARNSTNQVNDTSTLSKARAPRLPVFGEKDDIDSYLERFERFSTSQKWPKATWAINLSALLTGKTLEVYQVIVRL